METIGVFFGGKSPEHDISIITGQLVISGLKGLGYHVVPVYLDKQGSWFAGGKLDDLSVFTRNKTAAFTGLDQVVLDLEKSRGRLILRSKKLLSKEIKIDLVFPAFHGMNGEDGTIQGMMEILGVPYVGCDVPSSAISMDKILTKLLYQSVGIPTVPFVTVRYSQWQKSHRVIMDIIRTTLPKAVIVKPARLGSSIGISKAENNRELENALDLAFHFEDKVIVEEAVINLMDVTCCVIGHRELTPSLLQESVYGKDFFSYEDKYLKDGGAQLGKAKQAIMIPARLDGKTTRSIKETAVTVFQLLGCSGIARIDFLYDTKKRKFFANEVNTLPGTIYHHLWKKSGVELPELLTRLITYAHDRQEDKARLTYSFSSSVLSQTGSAKLKFKGE